MNHANKIKKISLLKNSTNDLLLKALFCKDMNEGTNERTREKNYKTKKAA